MILSLLGVASFAFAVWTIFALKPTAAGPHPILNWPMADMLVPVGIVSLMIMGLMLAVYGVAG